MKEDLRLRYLAVHRLNPYSGNPRTHSREQVRQIARSIERFGFINPVVVDGSGQLVAGHGRLLAAKELRLTRVPAIRVDHLSEDEKRAYLIADNKIALNANWDKGLLRIEIERLANVNFDVDLTGFSAPEIDIVLAPSDGEREEPPIPVPPSSEECLVQPRSLWQLGLHRVICGDVRDSRTVNRLMGAEKARLVFTDPPYNVPIDGHARGKGKHKHANFRMASGEMSEAGFTRFLTESLIQLARVCDPGALAYVCMDWRHMEELLAAGKSVFSGLANLCVWNKSSGGMGGLYRSKHELVFVFQHGRGRTTNNVQLGRFGRNRTNVWDYPGANVFGVDRGEALKIHPTVKPVRLVADAILDASKRGDIILDGFTGSGSTLIAAEQTGRVFRGVEIDPRYVEVMLKRWEQVSGESAIESKSGKTRTQLARKPRKQSVRSG